VFSVSDCCIVGRIKLTVLSTVKPADFSSAIKRENGYRSRSFDILRVCGINGRRKKRTRKE